MKYRLPDEVIEYRDMIRDFAEREIRLPERFGLRRTARVNVVVVIGLQVQFFGIGFNRRQDGSRRKID